MGTTFIFSKIELIFGRLSCIDMESILAYKLVLLISALFLKNNVCKKLDFPRVFLGDFLLNEKQKKSLFC